MPYTMAQLVQNARLKMLPEVAQRIITLAGDADTPIRAMEEAILRDQALVVRILKIANSPLYGLSREVADLRRAILVLGYNTIKDLALSVSFLNVFDRNDELAYGLWEHAIGVAAAARILSRELESASAGEAFVAGLMHDLGKGVLLVLREDDFRHAYRTWQRTDFDAVKSEQNIFGFDHAQLGRELCHSWNFSPLVTTPVAYHHDLTEPHVRALDCVSLWNVAIVSLADDLCHWLGIGGVTPRLDRDLIGSPANRILGFERDQLDRLLQDIELRYHEQRAVFLGD